MKETERTTLAAAIVRFLKAQRVRRDGREDRLFHGVFGIFGHGNVAGLGQALEEHGGGELPFFQPKNEQGGVHAAVAFAKARRRLGVMACTTSVGPGATNMITGAATATVNRLPVLLLPGDVFANRWPQPVLQQLEHPSSMDVSVNDCFRPVSRFWDRIHRPEQILASLPEAVRVLLDPAETGAVTLCLPEDVQAESFLCPSSFFEPRIHEVERRAPALVRIAEAARLLAQAKRPLLIAGGGVHYSDATAALAAFAAATRIPVAMTQAGMGAVLADHPSWLGALGVTGTACANRIAEEADVVIAVGTRLSDFTTASKTQFQDANVRFIGVNENAADARKHGALAIVADARVALEALAAALAGVRFDDAPAREARRAWLAARAELTGAAAAQGSAPLTQAQLIRVMNERVGGNATVVHAAGGIPGDIHKLWLSRDAADYHSEYGYSCMGYEVAGALGVKLAEPAREVYALLGDGSFLMMANELLTSIQEGQKIVVVLVDNHGYQCIHNLQRGTGGRSFGNELRRKTDVRVDGDVVPVDFVKNAESLGARAFRATTERELVEALDAAAQADRSCLIYVPLEEPSRLPGTSWWDVPVPEVSGVSSVKEARADYEKALLRRRFYY
jgi:3D-(3,5/4)-trihydroxycyclohexane-1,2-dione acylhydrolase (decyclizing)